MRDRVLLRGLQVFGRRGVESWEREREQPFLVDLEVFLDLSRAARADRMEDALDYTLLAARVREAAGQEGVLLEALAERVAGVVLSFPGVLACRVRVRKPAAALLLGAEEVACEVYREGAPGDVGEAGRPDGTPPVRTWGEGPGGSGG